jgi:CspA family cold shock protein
MHGTIRWLNRAKGYGFLAREDGGEDAFARFPVATSLAPGDAVSFALVESDRGPLAIDLVPGHVPNHGED